MKFHVDALHSFKVSYAPDKKGRTDGRTDETRNKYMCGMFQLAIPATCIYDNNMCVVGLFSCLIWYVLVNFEVGGVVKNQYTRICEINTVIA